MQFPLTLTLTLSVSVRTVRLFFRVFGFSCGKIWIELEASHKKLAAR